MQKTRDEEDVSTAAKGGARTTPPKKRLKLEFGPVEFKSVDNIKSVDNRGVVFYPDSKESTPFC